MTSPNEKKAGTDRHQPQEQSTKDTADCMQGAGGSHPAISAKPVAMHVLPESIPDELKQYPQWVLWRSERDGQRWTKRPYSPRSGARASVTDPSTWGTFAEAVEPYQGGGYDGIGFVLTKDDPFAIIDLDRKDDLTQEQCHEQTLIWNTFESYSELSPSRKGAHIVMRGRIQRASKRKHIEIYDCERFMTFTGCVSRDLPIVDCQERLDEAFQQPPNRTATVELEEHDDILTDSALVDMAMNAANADKFNQLCRGEWKAMDYPSQSEADFALLSILCFYTRSDEQVRRIFRMTALGKREKATRDDKYLNRALTKIRATQPEPLDFSQLIENAEAAITAIARENTAASTIAFPPGRVGELAQYFCQTAVRPVPEIALAAALAVTAGVCGRSYNVSGTGLNQYLILLARTGTGKEGAQHGIDKLVTAVRQKQPIVDQFIGPGVFASGQALIKVLDEKPCFVSVLGEFGLTLQQLSDNRANGAQVMLRKVLLDLYAKSGWSSTLLPMVYSDITKNTSPIHAPNVTILGESTPETFFDGLDSSHVAEGLIPRFLLIEYDGPRPRRNRNAGIPPSEDLVQRFADLVASSITAFTRQACNRVHLDGHSVTMLDAFDEDCDDLINNAAEGPAKQIWNRAHLQALKIAALIAVGVNPHAPLITGDIAAWSIDLIKGSAKRLLQRFESGDVGQGDGKQMAEIRRIVTEYLDTPGKQLMAKKGYEITSSMARNRIIPYHYFSKRALSLSAFRHDKLGATNALRKTLQSMVACGLLIELSKNDLKTKHEFDGTAYAIGSTWARE